MAKFNPYMEAEKLLRTHFTGDMELRDDERTTKEIRRMRDYQERQMRRQFRGDMIEKDKDDCKSAKDFILLLRKWYKHEGYSNLSGSTFHKIMNILEGSTLDYVFFYNGGGQVIDIIEGDDLTGVLESDHFRPYTYACVIGGKFEWKNRSMHLPQYNYDWEYPYE